MHRKVDYEKHSFFERVKLGLEQSIAYSRGELSLRTTTLPLPPPPASPKRVAALRRKLKMSQSVFAAALNVSPKLVQSWEQGVRHPSRVDLRLIQIIEKQPQLLGELFAPPKATPLCSRAAPKRPHGREGVYQFSRRGLAAWVRCPNAHATEKTPRGRGG